MQNASVATTKNELSRLLRQVKRGKTIVITERNHPIARLQPIPVSEAGSSDIALAALHESGALLPPAGAALDVAAFLAAPRPSLSSAVSLAAAVLAEREDGR
jgi:prevent-host-death family protein